MKYVFDVAISRNGKIVWGFKISDGCGYGNLSNEGRFIGDTIENNTDDNYNTIILDADWILKQEQKPKTLVTNYNTFFGYYYNKSTYSEEHETFTHLVILDNILNETKNIVDEMK